MGAYDQILNDKFNTNIMDRFIAKYFKRRCQGASHYRVLIRLSLLLELHQCPTGVRIADSDVNHDTGAEFDYIMVSLLHIVLFVTCL
ncbi:hypothetical protein Hanom_Chr09g00788771 [Helianthus anomalus]